MSTLLDDLKALLEPTPGARPAAAASRREPTAPTAELDDFDGARGGLTVRGEVPVHDWQEVLKIALPPGFDPEDYVLTGSPRVTSHTILVGDEWQNVQAWWKIGFARKDVVEEESRDLDAERLHEELTDWTLPAGREALTGDVPFVVNVADLQIGQLDDGGTAYTVQRIKECMAGIRERVAALRAMGRNLGTAVLAGLGDLVEGCTGFYAMQEFTVDLDGRDQSKVVRRLLVELLKLLVELGFEEIIVIGVGGNHGEMRVDSKAVTTFNDNTDVAVFESAYDIIRETPHADRFSWYLPTDDLVVNAQVGDRRLGWTHGHLAKVAGATPQKKLQTWWEKQCLSFDSPVRDVDLFITAHYHHFSAIEYPRVHLQTPAVCGSSKWWYGMTGQGSVPGLLTFTVPPSHIRPFADLEIITPNL